MNEWPKGVQACSKRCGLGGLAVFGFGMCFYLQRVQYAVISIVSPYIGCWRAGLQQLFFACNQHKQAGSAENRRDN